MTASPAVPLDAPIAPDRPRGSGRVLGLGAAQWALAGIVLLGLGLRLATLRQSLFGDELFTYEIATRASLGDVLAGVRSSLEVTPPLYFLFPWLSAKAGDPMLWLRIPSVIFGTVTIPLVYLLGREAGGRAAGLVAAALWALSPFAIFYGVEARAYGLMAMLIAVSTLVLLRAGARGGAWRWALFGGLTAAALYTHYTAIFAVAAQGAWALAYHRERWRPLLLAFAGAGLAFVPWLGELAKDQSATGSQIIQTISPFGARTFVTGLGRWLDGSPFIPLGQLPGHAWLAVGAAGVILGAAGAAHRWRSGPRRPVPPAFVLTFAVGVSAPLGTAGYSLVGTDVFAARNLMSSLPCALAALAVVVTRPERPLSWIATGLVGIAAAAGAVQSLEPANARMDYAGAAAYVDRVARRADTVYEVNFLDPRGPPGRQLSVNFARPHRYILAGVGGGLSEALRSARNRRLVVVVPLVGSLAAGPRTPAGRHLVAARRFPGLVPLGVFAYDPGDGRGLDSLRYPARP